MRNYFKLISFCILFLTILDSNGQLPQPVLTYLDGFSFTDTSRIAVKGQARILSIDKRMGINMTSIHSALQLKKHTLNQPQGTVTVWFLPLEDMSHFPMSDNLKISNENIYTYPLLSDSPNPQDFNAANFKLVWDGGWHPNLLALFAKGSFYEDAFNLPYSANVSSSHASFKKNTWYQITLTWDYPNDKYSLYINGVLVGRENQFKEGIFHRDSIRTSLFTGNPALAISTIKFYNNSLTKDDVYKLFHSEVTHFDRNLETELQYMYEGKNRKPFIWQPDNFWLKKFDISLSNPIQLDSFYVQGKPVNVSISEKGLLIETINKCYTGALLDSQMYLFSKKVFEGDLYVEYEFNSLRPGGLSLLMTQASGMNREDFMADYPLRTSGRMSVLYGEDIRNYHWEYYRDMSDTRNDVLTSGLIKNPFTYPLAFGCLDKPLEKNKWHKLQFLQIDNKITGAIDGIIMIEATDNGFSNHGSVYNFGHIAIRCMLHTKMLFRNLKVYNRNVVQTISLIKTIK